MALISIGLPVYNGEQFIEDSLRSLASQTLQDFELIICDNASTDRTEEICRAYKEKFENFKYIRNPVNYGAAKNYNLAFSRSTGEYFKWTSYDDMIAPTFLEKCSQALERDSSLAIAHTQTVLIDESGQETGLNLDDLTILFHQPYQRLAHLFKNYNLCNPIFGLIRSESLKKTGLIGNYVGSDYITLVELCLLGKIIEIREPLFFRRDHPKNVRKLPLEERAKWFDTSYNGREHKKPAILLLRKQIDAILTSELSLGDKLLCSFQLYHWLIRKMRAEAGKRKQLVKDLLRKNIG